MTAGPIQEIMIQGDAPTVLQGRAVHLQQSNRLVCIIRIIYVFCIVCIVTLNVQR